MSGHDGHGHPDRDDGLDAEAALLARPRRGIGVGRVQGQRVGRLRGLRTHVVAGRARWPPRPRRARRRAGSRRTVARSVARLTFASATPSVWRRKRSMRLTQEAQVMPSTPTERTMGRGALTALGGWPVWLTSSVEHSNGGQHRPPRATPLASAASGPPASWRRRPRPCPRRDRGRAPGPPHRGPRARPGSCSPGRAARPSTRPSRVYDGLHVVGLAVDVEAAAQLMHGAHTGAT